MFVKSLELSQFWNIKVVSFEISNPDSLGVKTNGFYRDPLPPASVEVNRIYFLTAES